MKVLAGSLAVLALWLPRAASAEDIDEAELPTPAESAQPAPANEPNAEMEADEWLNEPPKPVPAPVSADVEEPTAPEEHSERPRKREIQTNEYGLPLPSENAVVVRLAPKVAGTSVRLVSRADGIKKHEGVYCDEPCTLTLEPGDYGIEVWKDGHKTSGRRVRILEAEAITAAPANRQLAYGALAAGIAGAAVALAGYFLDPFFIGAHGDGGRDDGSRRDVSNGMMLGGIAVASIGFPVFISNMPASLDRRPFEETSAMMSASTRFEVTSASSGERITGLSGGFSF